MVDSVNNPAHYGGADDPFEAIKVIEAWGLGYHLGNTLKYIRRADHKGDRLTDLEKARWFLDREIQRSKTIVAAPLERGGWHRTPDSLKPGGMEHPFGYDEKEDF